MQLALAAASQGTTPWDVISSLGTFVALVGVIVTFEFTRRGQKQERDIAEGTASRGEAAARIASDNTERVIAALETIAAQGKKYPPTVLTMSRPRWSLKHTKGDRYVLANVGDATAHDVKISTDPSLELTFETPPLQVIRPDEAVTFLALPDLETRDLTVTVEWDGGNGTRETWRYPLPPGR